MKNIVKNDKRQKLNRCMTGVIQEDRIWEQWYDQSIFSLEFPKMNQKDYLLNCIGEEKSSVIINNCGMKKITVDEFSKMILRYEKSFNDILFLIIFPVKKFFQTFKAIATLSGLYFGVEYSNGIYTLTA